MKLYIKEDYESIEGEVQIYVPYIYEYSQLELDGIVGWCTDYLHEYGLDAYVPQIRTNEELLTVEYEIENPEYTSPQDVERVIKQAVDDYRL